MLNSERRAEKYVLLDRDGVINAERGDYTTTIDEWEWATGALKGLRILTEHGYGIIVVTNQSCIAKGRQTEEGLAVLNRYMIDTARSHGGDIFRVYHCPHYPPEECDCRKPKPGMIIEAARDFDFDLSSTFFVGDTARDMEAGNRAGTRTILIEGLGTLRDSNLAAIPAEFRAGDLVEAAAILLAEGGIG